MTRRRFRGPVRPDGDGFVVDLSPDEVEVLRRMLGDLRVMLTADEPDPLLERLFPVVHPADPEAEAEYQRLMREELVASKLAAFERVDDTLAGDGRLDELGLMAFMQAINSLRLVLGTLLDIDDDEVAPEVEESAEYHLFDYLAWLLDWSVRAMQS